MLPKLEPLQRMRSSLSNIEMMAMALSMGVHLQRAGTPEFTDKSKHFDYYSLRPHKRFAENHTSPIIDNLKDLHNHQRYTAPGLLETPTPEQEGAS